MIQPVSVENIIIHLETNVTICVSAWLCNARLVLEHMCKHVVTQYLSLVPVLLRPKEPWRRGTDASKTRLKTSYVFTLGPS